MTTYLITGAGRGLGLALTAALSQQPNVSLVLAATRSREPSAGLSALMGENTDRVAHVLCDVSSQDSVEAAVAPITAALGGRGLDVLINNVGMQIPVEGGIENMPGNQLVQVFNNNVLSAHRMTAALMPVLRQGRLKKVVNISTTLGSIGMAPGFALAPQPAYKVTKAALNMLTVQYALDYEKEGFTFVALSPGSELGGSAGNQPPFAAMADLTVEEGAKACVDQILQAGPSKNGTFLNVHVPGWESKPETNRYDGKSPSW